MPRNKQYQQMKTVFDTISEGVIATDKSGLITYINRAAAKMLQLNNTDSIGGNIDTVLPFHSLLKKSLTSGQFISHHEVFIPERNVHYMVSSQPIFDETQSV
jgi:transcriptional regulator of aroF, aroG, tyrA and aromatic amino acid transport